MPNVTVIGAQWGDEGKGKVVDWLASRADIVVRFQGGHNAGHTLVVGNQVYKLSLLPSGLVRGKMGVIGNGVVIDPEALLAEIDRVRRAGPGRVAGQSAHRRQRHPDPAGPPGAGTARARRHGATARSAPPGAASARPTRTRWRGGRSGCATSPSPRRSTRSSTRCCCTTTRCCAGWVRRCSRSARCSTGCCRWRPRCCPTRSRCGSGWTRRGGPGGASCSRARRR